MLIEVADRSGIRIPRFCYHNKLSVAANCRMCLVEVEKAPKPLPACATPVMDGMKVFTRSPKALAAQKSTMEFLLINHPLDCPICDQGGECELQDVAIGYGGDVSKYSESKRVVQDKNIGPLIATEMTRCIHCTRCVRFGMEVAGIRELGATGRGEFTRIGTYIEQSVNSEMSGNIIDLCPVGALTAKPSKYSARAWELISQAGIAPHDCVGSNIYVHTFRGKVNRVVPRDNEKLNECWLSDRDRFSYEGVNSEQRLTLPMVKKNGQWQEAEWGEALELAVNGVQKVCRENGAEQLGALISSSATTEEMYLLNNLMNGLGSNNLDHRLRQSDFLGQDSAPVFPSLGISVDELEKLNAVLLIGSNVGKEQPIIAHRLRKAAMSGAHVMFINIRDFDVNFNVSETIVAAPDVMVNELAAVAKAVSGSELPGHLDSVLEGVSPDARHAAIAENLKNTEKAVVLLGAHAHMCPDFSLLIALAELIAEKTNASVGYLSEGANSSGAWLAGAVPHRNAAGHPVDAAGLDAQAMLEQPRKAYILHSVEPEYDCWNPAQALKALNSAEFVVMLSSYITDAMREYADVLLPVAPFSETSGAFVNIEGSWQSFTGASKPAGDARPAWKVLRVLGNLLDLEGFEYTSSEEILDELKSKLGDGQLGKPSDNRNTDQIKFELPSRPEGVQRISGVSIYSVDAVTRRATSLQKTADGMDVAVRLNADLAQHLNLNNTERVLVRQNGCEVSMAMRIDDGIPENCVWVPVGNPEAAKLGAMFGAIELEAD